MNDLDDLPFSVRGNYGVRLSVSPPVPHASDLSVTIGDLAERITVDISPEDAIRFADELRRRAEMVRENRSKEGHR